MNACISRKERKEHKEEGVFLDYTSSFSFMAIHPIGEKIKLKINPYNS